MGKFHSINSVLIVDFNSTAPLYSYYLAKGFKDLGWKAEILGQYRPNYFLTKQERMTHVGFSIGSKLISYVLNWVYLIAQAKKHDIIIVQWLQLLKFTNIEIELVRILKKRNSSTYYIVHNLLPHNNKSAKIRHRYNKLYSVCDNLLVHTKDAKKIFEKLFDRQKNVLQIQHGYFYEEFNERPTTHKKKTFLIVGHISRYKGIEDAIKANAIVKSKGLDLELVIKGKGDSEYVDELLELSDNLGVNNNTHIEMKFVGTKQLLGLYATSFCSVLPYRKIEQSGVVFTSLGLAVPVVCYDVGGFSEIIRDKVNGRLVEPNNIEALAEAITWVYNHQNSKIDQINNEYRGGRWKNTSSIVIKDWRKNKL
ncbi:glycosyltransferase [Flagellimonas sp.]|uniref:glycosyltransferase n=1 Tax=Flagellimonas sp. TaxID=2058762 RepID=UPI003B50A97F